MDKINQVKRRKSKENIPKDPTADKPAKKRIPVKYDWKQTGSEVIISLHYGPDLDDTCYTLNSSNNHCTVLFKDGKEWSCNFHESIVDAGTSVECRGNQLVIMLIKNVPYINWPQLEAVSEEVERGKTNGSVTAIEEEDTKICAELNEVTAVEVLNIKKDLIEKGDGSLTIYLYVKCIEKESVSIQVEEQSLCVSFHTKDKKFLVDNCCKDKLESRFMWQVKLKELVLPNRVNYCCMPSHLAITLHKRCSQIKWDSIEASPSGPKKAAVVHDTWFPMRAPSKRRGIARSVPSVLSATQLVADSNTDNKEMGKKPTCKVTPMSVMLAADVLAPGLTGLENLGNTCFMNSVIQCLVNCREFRNYFLDSHCQRDINRTNPLGMEGKLALCFAVLCRTLWDGKRKVYEPSQLKNFISMKATQFTGFAQHDAQEFMAFLLDGLHEDLNRIEKRPYVEAKDWDGRPDKVVADESWEMYKKRNDSIVVDLFQGQYKSKLVCPVCEKVSITFDPFLYLSVPLPKKVRVIPIVFFAKDPLLRPIKHPLRVAQDATAEEMKTELSKVFKVKPENLRIFEVYKNKIHCFFTRGNSLGSISPTDLIFAFEVYGEKQANEPVIEVNVLQRLLMPSRALKCSFCKRDCSTGESKLRRCTKCYRASYCDQLCQRNHWNVHKDSCKRCPELVGLPFVVSLPKSRATYSNLCKVMEAYARYSVDVFQPPQVTDNLSLHCGISSSATMTRETSQAVTGDVKNESDISFIFDQSQPFNQCPTINSENVLSTPPPLLTPPPYLPMSIPPSNSSIGQALAGEGSNIQYVIGQPRNDSKVERADPLFLVTPINQHGISLPGAEFDGIMDKGEEPLSFNSSQYLAIDWRNDEKMKNYVLVQSKELDVECEQSDFELKEEHNHFTLDQCLTLFTEPEILSPGEAWYCPQCKQHREATKRMSVWRLPPVLIIQLKRFAFSCLSFRDKIDKLVKYPIRGLDMSNYYCGPQGEECGEQQPIYDLFAVINHQGSLLGGHYTAIARLLDSVGRNRSEIDWRLFDDSQVSFTTEQTAISRFAYVLFYRRRGLPFQFSSTASSPMVENLGIPNCVTALTIEDSDPETGEQLADRSSPAWDEKMDDDLLLGAEASDWKLSPH